jgi:hypothetical protein
MHHGNGEKRIEASGQTFLTGDQAAVLALEPGKCALGLEARDVLSSDVISSPIGFASGYDHRVGAAAEDLKIGIDHMIGRLRCDQLTR